jgi:LDH2 family malate/lactate/ureidoglycolate dehydrogenase
MLYGDPSAPYGCAHLFLALDAERFGVGAEFPARTAKLAQKIRASRRAPGVEGIYAPGDIERERAAANGERCPVSADTLSKLVASGRRIGIHWT